MKKKIGCEIATIVLFAMLIWGINQWKICSDDFFYWCDAYIAVPCNSEYVLAITYFYEENPIDFSNISSLEFVDTHSSDIVSFDYFPIDGAKEYKSIGMELNIHFSNPSIEEVERIRITFNDGSIKEYPIGTWAFDIGEQNNGALIDIWSSPVASSDSMRYPYFYCVDPKISNISIQYGMEDVVERSITDSLQVEGEVIIKSEAPLKLIKPKIVYRTNDGTNYTYGQICYCGALNVDEESIKKSKEFYINNI